MISIDLAENGYIVTNHDAEPRTIVVVQEQENHLECLRSLLHEILEVVGYYGSKHDPERLFVEIRKQKQ